MGEPDLVWKFCPLLPRKEIKPSNCIHAPGTQSLNIGLSILKIKFLNNKHQYSLPETYAGDDNIHSDHGKGVSFSINGMMNNISDFLEDPQGNDAAAKIIHVIHRFSDVRPLIPVTPSQCMFAF